MNALQPEVENLRRKAKQQSQLVRRDVVHLMPLRPPLHHLQPALLQRKLIHPQVPQVRRLYLECKTKNELNRAGADCRVKLVVGPPPQLAAFPYCYLEMRRRLQRARPQRGIEAVTAHRLQDCKVLVQSVQAFEDKVGHFELEATSGDIERVAAALAEQHSHTAAIAMVIRRCVRRMPQDNMAVVISVARAT